MEERFQKKVMYQCRPLVINLVLPDNKYFTGVHNMIKGVLATFGIEDGIHQKFWGWNP